MNESIKERARRHLNEMLRLKEEWLEAASAADAAEDHAKSKREQLTRVNEESIEAQKAANVAHELVAAKREELDKLLGTRLQEWRDETEPLN